MGFCYFSNVAVAALDALAAPSITDVGPSGSAAVAKVSATEQVERVAIWDFDGHHGNGTEAIVAGNERIRFGPLVEVRGVWLNATLVAPDDGISESRDFAVPVPAFGADLDAYPHEKVQVFASVAGTPDNRFGHLIDADFGIKVFPIKNVGVTAGYRYFDLKGKDDDDFATARIKGFTIGAAFRF